MDKRRSKRWTSPNTRQMILHKAAELINIKGYTGASLSDLMNATGLGKSAIYNYFGNKENLAVEAFDYATSLIIYRLKSEIQGSHDSMGKLGAIIRAFRATVVTPPLAGGCPLLNTAVDSDDTHPFLRDRALHVAEKIRKQISGLLATGIAKAELRLDVTPESVASFILAAVEGGILLSKLYGDSVHMDRVVEQLDIYLHTIKVTSVGIEPNG